MRLPPPWANRQPEVPPGPAKSEAAPGPGSGGRAACSRRIDRHVGALISTGESIRTISLMKCAPSEGPSIGLAYALDVTGEPIPPIEQPRPRRGEGIRTTLLRNASISLYSVRFVASPPSSDDWVEFNWRKLDIRPSSLPSFVPHGCSREAAKRTIRRPSDPAPPAATTAHATACACPGSARADRAPHRTRFSATRRTPP